VGELAVESEQPSNLIKKMKIGRHWWLLIPVSVGFISLEIYQYLKSKFNPLHMLELGFYVLFLVIIGSLIERLLRVMQDQTRTLKILDYKRKISQDYLTLDNWFNLTAQIAKFPSTIAPVDESCLFWLNPLSAQLENAGHWSSGNASEGSIGLCNPKVCNLCLTEKTVETIPINPCRSAEVMEWSPAPTKIYCFPIRYGEDTLALIRFRVTSGALTEEQKDILTQVSPEIALVLKEGYERKALEELRAIETSLIERRKVSYYLHDYLGQNLGFINLKLDQLLIEKDRLTPEMVIKDLENMKDAAKESYDIVHGVLETITPESSPLFTNKLLEHARQVAQKAHFDVAFKYEGTPLTLSPEVQGELYHVFREAFSNIEKHAHASKVDVSITWGEDYLDIVIDDNGIGFYPDSVDKEKHLGLGIMHERIAEMNGKIAIETCANAGTTVSIHLPISLAGQERTSVSIATN
jgi:signal transduction histidine kinase